MGVLAPGVSSDKQRPAVNLLMPPRICCLVGQSTAMHTYHGTEKIFGDTFIYKCSFVDQSTGMHTSHDTKTGASMVQWWRARMLVYKWNDQFCTRGMIYSRNHLISPGCPPAQHSLTSAKLWHKTPIIS